MNRFTIKISVEELNLPLCVYSGQVFRWEQIATDRWLGVNGGDWFACDVFEDNIVVRSNTSEDAFRELFRIDSVPREAEILRDGPEMAPYLEAIRGLRVLAPDPVETLFGFLCTPNNNLVRIHKMVRFLGSFGDVIGEVDGHVIREFPNLECLAGVSVDRLRENGFGYRAANIPAAAQTIIARGEGWFDAQMNATFECVHDELLTVRGIGPKLADCIALFGFRKLESVPVDTHIWQAASRLYFSEWVGTTLTDKKYRAVGEHLRNRFGSNAGWVQQFLFYDNMVHWRDRKLVGIPANR